ncbi:MAG: Hsp20 family protein [Cenarchaeum sp. SB0665_bin_23]|nr:Hsp20 family protein [Cenarchaeum sp. SB0667_bin_13]MXY37344.1 Hsp20 family protein [Cenarchaeum sp. SB0664_bin_35]MXY61191.1 Hsp20 family protein [Cenarchaeum sp. SB0665_bin_23]MXZ94096.1 Hsp20 family protein [Cenarchaeum sp. SB0666_bin_15]MYB46593.1 Hsp20 family protein [Cenarchaeum sp. SB0662_bin_33]MYC80191.1 Hsp20 family protein [Cenarchaeum sp. SB0661_bin_35]MYD58064.1 Hsp20 family protein [Cenarchaeum sp. SB0678_bin_8]MYG33662.1 Hsp20 family protein [Cenarchaeum sp. SB0677_bin_16]
MGVIHGSAKESGDKMEKQTGCGFLPQIVKFMGKEFEQGISSKAQEFYSYVMPATDMQRENNLITVSIDLPGFKKEDIKIKLDGNILWVSANRTQGKGDATTIYRQRPHTVETRIKIPASIEPGEEPECPTTLQDGVLVLNVPIPESGRDITIS